MNRDNIDSDMVTGISDIPLSSGLIYGDRKHRVVADYRDGEYIAIREEYTLDGKKWMSGNVTRLRLEDLETLKKVFKSGIRVTY